MAAAALVVASVLPVLAPSAAPAADPCAPPVASAVACENTRPGSPASEWDVAGSGDGSIQGFATDMSVNKGEVVTFKVDTAASQYRLDLYRLGYYGGAGARKVATVAPSARLPQAQPSCLSDAATGLIDCGNWAPSASWAVPADAVSGVYVAKLVRSDTGGSSHVVFVVRDDTGGSALLFQTADTTWQAYNAYGGNSLYTGQPAGRAYKVSYNRPFLTRGCCSEDWLFNAEYPMIRWLEANGYDISYTTGVDSDRRGAEIVEHKVFLSVGHDEYWSGPQRANVEAARAAGVHLGFFSGNEVFWKTRWEPSIDGAATSHRTLVSYKETRDNADIDPDDAWTGTWRDPRFSPPADGGRPENALTGQLFTVNDPGTVAIRVPADDGKMRLWRDTSVATLAEGQTATLAEGTLGYEWDEDVDNAVRPAGIVRLSTSTYSMPSKLLDYGSTYGPGTATHHLTLYRHPSGALVFGAGTIQWPWGLDAKHDRGNGAPDPRMQQATVNLLADMGTQPTTLQTGLVPATASTDTVAASSTITFPAPGATVPAGAPVTVTGTATDGGGGRVGGVEVSVDGGASWHPANGRASWSYTFTPGGGSVTIRSRAVDDSANMETPSPGVTVNASGSRSCPCTIWDASAAPAVSADPDTSSVEVGVKFRTDVTGYITGIRFYKASANTGTHVGNLWTAAGAKLASVTFSEETASGWQQANLTTPVRVNADTTYVVSYHAPVGRYSVTEGDFASAGADNPPLHALANGVDGANGVYRYGPSGFPTNSYQATNYWVDVVFGTESTTTTTTTTTTTATTTTTTTTTATTTTTTTSTTTVPPTTTTTAAAADTTPPTVISTQPAADAGGVALGSKVSATFSEPVDAASISFTVRDSAGRPILGNVTYNASTRTATFSPLAGLAPKTTYTASVTARDLAGNSMTTPKTWSFRTKR